MINPGHMWGYGWGGWGGMLVGGLLMLLFWAAVIALAFVAIRAILRSDRSRDSNPSVPARSNTSLEILKDRYARGEITREEYLNIRRDLEE